MSTSLAAARPNDLGAMSSDDFKTFVLYYHPADINSRKALDILGTDIPETMMIQNITSLQELPAYVDGVPVLACKKSKTAYKGTCCLDELKKLKKETLSFAGNRSVGISSALGHAQSFSTEGLGGSKISALNPQRIDFDASEEPLMLTDGKRVSDDDVSNYMARRSAMTDHVTNSIKRQNGGKNPIGARAMGR